MCFRCLYDIASPFEEPVKLTCQVAGQPYPEVTWYLNGIELEESKNIHFQFDANNVCSLLIRKLSKDLTGVYLCCAKNDHGETKSSCCVKRGKYLKTGEPPVFLKGLSNHTASIGGAITMGVLLRDQKVVKITKEYIENMQIENTHGKR